MDHGDEFVNDEMPGLGNQCGINIKRTAAYSPWANGLDEHNHATIDIMMKKCLKIYLMLMKIQLFSIPYVLGIVTFIYVRGFTPAQLAIGQNPQLQSTFHDSLPTLEGCTNSSIIAQNLKAIAAPRKAFVHAKTSAKASEAIL